MSSHAMEVVLLLFVFPSLLRLTLGDYASRQRAMSIAEVLPRRSKSASLELKPRSDLVVLTPNIGRLDEPRLDSSIAGTVLLHLPKEAKIKTLVVELVCESHMYPLKISKTEPETRWASRMS